MKKLLFAFSIVALLAAGCNFSSSYVASQPPVQVPVVKTTTLSSPGNLKADQLASYPRCDSGTNKTFPPQLYTCGIGQDVGYYFITKSINSDNTVSFYVYSVQPAQTLGETWSPTVSTYTVNDTLSDECGIKISIDKIDYLKQNFTVGTSKGNGGCPQ